MTSRSTSTVPNDTGERTLVAVDKGASRVGLHSDSDTRCDLIKETLREPAGRGLLRR